MTDDDLFARWAAEQAIVVNNLAIAHFPNSGRGLQAIADINVSSVLGQHTQSDDTCISLGRRLVSLGAIQSPDCCK